MSKKKELTFNEFSRITRERCEKDIRPIKSWTALEYCGAAAGELGEMANIVKKIRRGTKKLDAKSRKEVAHEIADTISYLELVAASLDIDIEPALIEKFNLVSKKWGSKYRL
jgi:NTP pyrophosphatase (non-canonical NTP hydrolase)